MSRWLKLALALLLVLASVPAFPTQAQADSLCDFSGTHSKGAKYCIKMPPPGAWNGILVVFAHGYVPVTEPVDIQWQQMLLADGSYLPDVLNARFGGRIPETVEELCETRVPLTTEPPISHATKGEMYGERD